MAHVGDFLIYTAAVSALASLIFYFLAWRGQEQYLSLGRNFFFVGVAAIAGSLGALWYSILTHDFSIAYVFSYSSTDLPLGLLISTLWAGQEGTFLLWIFYTAIMGIILLRTAGSYEKGNMFFVNLFILSLLLILIKKSPFELMPVLRTEGAGLNPLLQNYWMVIHPPIMFLGFSGVVFPFAFAMTALVERRYLSWSEAARRWTMFAWIALGVSLVMGGYWAYETLGWGGFWAWDPVENSSLIPWLFLTVQVHALFIKRQRRGLMRFSLVAVCLSFWSVLYGTFLTRSGILADFSVHSFVDLGINAFLVSGLLAFVGLGAFFLILRWRDIKPEKSYSRVASRSYLVTLGVVILFLGAVLVLLGTSSPLLTSFMENPSAVGLEYYFVTMTPIAIAILFLVALFPVYRWNDGLSKKNMLILGLSVFGLTVGGLLAFGVTTEVIYLLLFGVAAWALVPNGWAFIQSWRNGKIQAGYLSHVGLAVALIGAGASAGFETKQFVKLPQGTPVQQMGYDMTFAHIEETPKGFNCHVDISKDGENFTAVLPHEFPKNAEGVMKKPHVENYLSHDLYVAPNSFQPAEVNDRGQMPLKKGESATVDKYTITFHDYELDEHGSEEMTAAAVIDVTYDDATETVKPALIAKDAGVESRIARFDDGAGYIEIAGIRPEDGGVLLQLSGDFVPEAQVKEALLVIELSEKPLIILFWAGTILMFVGGIVSTVVRRRRRMRIDNRTITDASTSARVTASDAA